MEDELKPVAMYRDAQYLEHDSAEVEKKKASWWWMRRGG